MYVSCAIILCLFQLCLSETLLDNVNCGYKQSDSWLASSPWIAAIKVIDVNTGLVYTRCAGVLLNQKYVLTTASCFTLDQGTKIMPVQLDISYRLNFTLNQLSLQYEKSFYGIEKTTLHPQYDAKTGQNDIALIRLNRLVPYTSYAQPICLPFDKSPTEPFFTGTWAKPFFSLMVEKVNVPALVTCNSCEEITAVEVNNENAEHWGKMHKGSPLMFTVNNQSFILGFLKQMNNRTGVFISVYPYLDWIKNNIASNYNTCTTPDGEESKCIFIEDCPVLLKAFANPTKNNSQYLANHLCSDDETGGFQVCCPKSLNVVPFNANLDKLSEKRYCGFQHRDDYFSTNEYVSLDEFPWLATIRAIGQNGKEYSACSGTLINNQYVLTSANCIRKSRGVFAVRLGEYNTDNKTDCVNVDNIGDDCYEAIDFQIDQVSVHGFYNHYTYSNDIAVIKLKQKVIFSDHIRPICLPTPKFKSPQINDTLYTTSFEEPKDWGIDPLKKKLYYSLVSNDMCSIQHKVNDFNMCLLPVAKLTDPLLGCYNDDGAPALASYKNQWTLEGITNERSSFCEIILPVVVTKVSSYLPWISEVISSS